MKQMNDVIECTARPGILKFKRDGAMQTANFRDAKHTKPYVCQCECEAKGIYLDLLALFAKNAIVSAMDGVPIELFLSDGKVYQDPNSFYYVYVDEEPAELDASADAFQADAESTINRAKSL